MITMRYLADVLRKRAGEDEGVDLDGNVLDTEFADLGYDSLAMHNTIGQIELDHNICLPDDLVTTASTPRQLIASVNEHLTQPA